MIHTIIDCIGIAGILMLAYGLYIVSPQGMFIVIGAMFIIFSLCAEAGTITIRKKRED